MFDFCAGEPDFLFLCVPLLCGVFACILRVRASLRDGCGLCARQPGCAQFPPLLAFLTACGDVTYVRLLPKNTLVMHGGTRLWAPCLIATNSGPLPAPGAVRTLQHLLVGCLYVRGLTTLPLLSVFACNHNGFSSHFQLWRSWRLHIARSI
ncbi:UNVERIFIED_ORG: hypothetical protein C0V67_00495 [Anaplasma ovis]